MKYALLLGSAVIFIDYLIKAFVNASLPLLNFFPAYPYGGIGIFRDFLGIQFSIVHTINTGAALSILHDWPRLLVVIRLLFVAALILWVVFGRHGKKIVFPATLIISGAMGNLIDYFVYGHVIDYVYLVFFGWPYPIFNLADGAIFIGVALLFFRNYGSQCSSSFEKTG